MKRDEPIVILTVILAPLYTRHEPIRIMLTCNWSNSDQSSHSFSEILNGLQNIPDVDKIGINTRHFLRWPTVLIETTRRQQGHDPQSLRRQEEVCCVVLREIIKIGL